MFIERGGVNGTALGERGGIEDQNMVAAQKRTSEGDHSPVCVVDYSNWTLLFWASYRVAYL
jgi:hypothetical protein